jgi:hypothetical protein
MRMRDEVKGLDMRNVAWLVIVWDKIAKKDKQQ